jgi:hypothetical protein
MIGRFFRSLSRAVSRGRAPARVTWFTPREYLRARACGRGMVRIELPASGALLPFAPGTCGGAADLGPAAFPSSQSTTLGRGGRQG